MATRTKAEFAAVLGAICLILNCGGGGDDGGGGGNKTVTVESDKKDGSKGASITMPKDSVPEDETEIKEGSDIANDVAGAYLGMPEGVKPASGSVSVSADDKYAKEATSGRIKMSIPLKNEQGEPLAKKKQDRVAIFYHVRDENGERTLGAIPPKKFEIKEKPLGLVAKFDYARFNLRGFGVYQAALLPRVPDGFTEEVTKKTESTIKTKEELKKLTFKFEDAGKYDADRGVKIAGGKATVEKIGFVDDFKADGAGSLDSLSGLTHDSGSGLRIESGTTGSAVAKVFDGGSAGAKWNELSLETNFPPSRQLPDNGATISGFESGNIDMAGNLFLAHLDEDGQGNTSGVGSQTLTVQNGAEFVAGQHVAGVLNLTGGSTNPPHLATGFSCTDLQSGGTTQPFTIMAWVYRNNISPVGSETIIGATDSATNSCLLDMSGDFGWGFAAGGGAPQVSYSDDPLGQQWVHVAVTYDGNDLKLYLNGTEEASQTSPAGIDNLPADNVHIGAENNDGTATDGFPGAIDEVAIFEGALAATEIQKFRDHALRGVGGRIQACAEKSGCSEESWSNWYDPVPADGGSLSFGSAVEGRYVQYELFMRDETGSSTALFVHSTKGAQNERPGRSSLVIAPGKAASELARLDHEASGDGSVTYQVAVGDGGWRYWNDGKWKKTSSLAKANGLRALNKGLLRAGGELGSGKVKVRAILEAPAGKSPATLEKLSFEYVPK